MQMGMSLSLIHILKTDVKRVDGLTLAEAVEKYNICKKEVDTEAKRIYSSAPGNKFNIKLGSQNAVYKELDTDCLLYTSRCV